MAILMTSKADAPGPLASLFLKHRRSLVEIAGWLAQERLAVTANAMIQAHGLPMLWPNSARSILQDQWLQQKERTVLLLKSLASIDRAFGDAGIEFLVLKGLPLAEVYYGSVDQRFTWDLDLLVRCCDVAKANRTLHLLRLNPPRMTIRLLGLAQRVTHALEFSGDDNLSLDLHWAFRRLPGVRFPSDEVFDRCQRISLGGLMVPVPTGEFLLTQLLLSIAADVDRGRCRWRALWDTYLVLRQADQHRWAEFLSRRSNEGCLGLICHAIALVVHSLGVAQEFPGLMAEVHAISRDSPRVSDQSGAIAILSRSPHDFRNHLEFAAWQDHPRWRYWPWWAMTLPARAFFARRI